MANTRISINFIATAYQHAYENQHEEVDRLYDIAINKDEMKNAIVLGYGQCGNLEYATKWLGMGASQDSYIYGLAFGNHEDLVVKAILSSKQPTEQRRMMISAASAYARTENHALVFHYLNWYKIKNRDPADIYQAVLFEYARSNCYEAVKKHLSFLSNALQKKCIQYVLDGFAEGGHTESLSCLKKQHEQYPIDDEDIAFHYARGLHIEHAQQFVLENRACMETVAEGYTEGIGETTIESILSLRKKIKDPTHWEKIILACVKHLHWTHAWTPELHFLFPIYFTKQIETLLFLQSARESKPNVLQSLPREILFTVFAEVGLFSLKAKLSPKEIRSNVLEP
ncbi:MAG TPA: hypothetical protein VNC84_00625 [Gammaproteobacteria bacterium]|nr:hypothetical protein [Gammaproteobacteria bacterium]